MAMYYYLMKLTASKGKEGKLLVNELVSRGDHGNQGFMVDGM